MDVKQRKVNDRRQNGARHILPTSIQSLASSTSSSSIQRGQNNRCTHTNDLQSINKLEPDVSESHFYPRDAMRKRGLCCRKMSVCHTPVLLCLNG